MTPVFRGTVTDGKLTLKKRKTFDTFLLTFKSGTPVKLTVKEWKNQRTLSQNAYYRGPVLEILSEYTGHTQNEMHGILGQKFLLVTTEGYTYVKSTADLDTKEFHNYLEEVIRFAAMELCVVIPDPTEVE